MKKLLEKIGHHKQEIESHLKAALAIGKVSENEIELYYDALAKLSHFSTQGKMLRGSLLLISYEMFGKNPQDIIPAASAIELFHSALLVHDDIIDDDSLRRGEPTIFAQYAQDQSKFYGQSMAICVGDIAFFKGIELLGNITVSADKKNEAISYFARELQNVGAAEMEDFHFGATDKEPSLESILNMYRLKSARYTFSLPLAVGAIISNQNVQTIKALEDFGENLGIVFQIVDDALGITGDEKVTGKPIGGDIRQNKKTVFRKLLFDAVSDEQKVRLGSIFGREVSSDEVAEIVKLAQDLGINEKIKQMVDDYSQKAQKILDELSISEEYKDLFRELIEYNLNRNK